MIEALTFQQASDSTDGVDVHVHDGINQEEGGKRALGQEEEEEESTTSFSRANTEHVDIGFSPATPGGLTGDVTGHVSISMNPVTDHSRSAPQAPNIANSPARLPSHGPSSQCSTWPVEFERYVERYRSLLTVCSRSLLNVCSRSLLNVRSRSLLNLCSRSLLNVCSRSLLNVCSRSLLTAVNSQ